MAAISLIDGERQWVKSGVNVAPEFPRSLSFCGYTILGDEPLVVLDATRDARFEGNPLVTGPAHIRFYAGCPLVISEQRVGTICVVDPEPRPEFTCEDRQTLRDLADLASDEIKHFRVRTWLGEQTDDMARLLALSISEQSPFDVAGFEAGIRRLAFLNRILLGLDAASNRLKAASAVLAALGEAGGWQAGLFWACKDRGECRCLATWKARGADVEAFLTTRSRSPRTSPPKMVGRIWEQRGPVWIADLATSEFSESGSGPGDGVLPSVALYPVRSPAGLEGIVELRGQALFHPDDAEVLLASIAARHLGAHLAYYRENEALVLSQSFLADAQKVARIGSWEYRGGQDEDAWSEEVYRLLGLDPGTKVKQSFETFLTFVHPDDRHVVMTSFYGSVRKGLPVDNRFRIVRKDGVIRRFHGRGQLAAAPDGPVRYVGTIQDVSDLEQALATIAEQAVEMRKREEVDAIKRAFIDAISHDLRTPLTAVEGYAELLEDGVAGPLNGRQLEFLGRLRESTSRISGLVQDLLDYGRLQAGLFHLHIEPACLVEITRAAMRSFEPAASRSAIEMRLESPDRLEVEGDSRRLSQAIANLLSNAIKFSGQGGRVVVRLIPMSDRARFEVEDRGPGISPEERDKLFKLYSQLPLGRDRGGTGLGLFISKAVVEAHGGTIGVDSEVGKGSRFWFEIPSIARPEAEPESAGKATEIL